MVRRYQHPIFATQYELSEGEAAHLDDLDWYLRRLRDVRDPILELAAGTGRLTLPLRRAGHRVVAVDIAHPMLRILTDKLARDDLGNDPDHDDPDRDDPAAGDPARGGSGPGSVGVVCADATRLPFSIASATGPRFGAAACAYNSLGCILEPNAVARAFAEAHAVLRPGSTLYLDVATHRAEDYANLPDAFDWEAWTTPDGERIQLRRQIRVAESGDRLLLAYTYRWASREETVDFALNLWPPERYVELAERAGFDVVEHEDRCYGPDHARTRMWFFCGLRRR